MLMCSAHRVELLRDILQNTPQARGRLLVDLINEPDGYSLTWDVSSLSISLYHWGSCLSPAHHSQRLSSGCTGLSMAWRLFWLGRILDSPSRVWQVIQTQCCKRRSCDVCPRTVS